MFPNVVILHCTYMGKLTDFKIILLGIVLFIRKLIHVFQLSLLGVEVK